LTGQQLHELFSFPLDVVHMPIDGPVQATAETESYKPQKGIQCSTVC